MCGRPLDKAFAFIGGHAIGPKCWIKKFSKPKTRIPKIYSPILKMIDETQKDLFDDSESI